MTERTPRWIMVLSVPGILLLLVPFVTLGWQAASSAAIRSLWSAPSVEAVGVSIWVALLATLACLCLGLPLAWLLAHGPARPMRALRAMCLAPLVMPPVVAGTGLLLAFGRQGWIGAPLRAAGITVSFTTGAAIMAATFVALPLLIMSLEAAFRSRDRGLEELALVAGASTWFRIVHVALPQVRRPLAAGVTLAFGRALGEFGATITFAGSFPGTTRTVPLAVYQLLQYDRDSAVALSIVLIAISVLIMWAGGRGLRAP